MMRFSGLKIVRDFSSPSSMRLSDLAQFLSAEQIASLRQSLPNILFPGGKISLGLDLRGGSASCDGDRPARTAEKRGASPAGRGPQARSAPSRSDLRRRRPSAGGVQVRIPNEADRERARTALQQIANAFLPKIRRFFGGNQDPAIALTSAEDGVSVLRSAMPACARR